MSVSPLAVDKASDVERSLSSPIFLLFIDFLGAMYPLRVLLTNCGHKLEAEEIQDDQGLLAFG